MSSPGKQSSSQTNKPETNNSGQSSGVQQTEKPLHVKLNETKISRRQFFFMIIQTQIGVGILSMPYDLHKVAKQDGWMSLILGGLLLQIVLLVLWLIARSYPELNFFQIIEKAFSKWIGKFISLTFIFYFVLIAILIVLLFGRMISLWVLPSTPFWVLSILMVMICLYFLSSNLTVIARLYTFLSFLLFFLFVLMIYSIKEIRIMYILPIMADGWGPVFKGMNQAILSFFGYIVSLVLFSRVEGKPKEKLKTIFQAHWFVLFFYLFIVLVSYTFFSTDEIDLVPEPVLYMLKSYEFSILARVDLFFISIWIVSVATSLTTYLFMATVGLLTVFNSQKYRLMSIIIGFIVFVIALFLGYDMHKVEMFSKYVVHSGYVFTVGFPFLMYMVIVIRKKFQKKGSRAT
ncbi:endospore germination permease [Halobacillus rhizosphaerae]|uniref:GerAB/ArcD/ProY family transporter n=1 Tax=Halobacillus rhizosphaerae TaxID=3064889 RepID=UPI00398B8D06